MHFPEELHYHREHTWARIDGDKATVGISDHAQKELGDVVFVELPKIGKKLQVGDIFGSVESSKSVSELVSPVAGEVAAVNRDLEDAPERINDDPYGEGWMIQVRLAPDSDASGLLNAEQYQATLAG